MKSFYLLAVIATSFLTVGAILYVYSQESADSLYKTRCIACHGAAGTADTVMGKKLGAASFRSPDVVSMTDAGLFTIIKKGKGKMPSFENKISDDQIRELIKYIRQLK